MKNVKNIIRRYIIFFLFFVSILLDNIINIPVKYKTNISEILIILLPMIITIISISLSLPSETIYGVTLNDFRKVRRDNCYSFLEMIIITCILFLLYSIFVILNYTISIWFINIISVFFLIRFIIQEIPILMKSERITMNIVKKALIFEIYNETFDNLIKGKKLYSIIQFIIMNKGIQSSYDFFKINENKKNKLIIDLFLFIYNDFLFDCSERKEYISLFSITTYNKIDILYAIDIALNSLNELLLCDKGFNIVEIYGDSDHYYQVTKLTSLLKKTTDILKLENKFEKDILNILNNMLFYNDSNSIKNFKYNFLNSMLRNSFSNNELWFIKLLCNTDLSSPFTSRKLIAYNLFLGIFFYYGIVVANKVPKYLKNDLKFFLFKSLETSNNNELDWYSNFKRLTNGITINVLFDTIKDLLCILGKEDRFMPWYMPKNCSSWSSEDGILNQELVYNCWLELIFYNNYSYLLNDKDAENTIYSLKEKDQYALAYYLNKNWYNDNTFKGLKSENSFRELFKLYLLQNNDKPSAKINNFFVKVKNEINKKYHQLNENREFINSNELKEKFIEQFNNAKKDFLKFNQYEKMNNKKEISYKIQFNKDFEKDYISNSYYLFKELFENIIIKKLENIKTAYDLNNNEKKLMTMINYYNYMTGNKYILFKAVHDEKMIEQFNKLNDVDFYSTCLFIWKKDAVKFNVECDENKTFARELNDEEINFVIENNYKVSDGLYKYNDGDNYRSIFISRDEIYKIIKKKYIYVCITFEYEIVLDKKNIIRFNDN